MSKVKFKIGDLVYCQTINNKISKITEANEDNDVFLDKAGWFKNTGLNVNGMPVILHATQENYELLSKLYPNVTFESPPKRKEPKEIIKAMFDYGWECVPCFVADSTISSRDFITEIDSEGDFLGRSVWSKGIPFDPETEKVIIDFVDGEVVLED